MIHVGNLSKKSVHYHAFSQCDGTSYIFCKLAGLFTYCWKCIIPWVL